LNTSVFTNGMEFEIIQRMDWNIQGKTIKTIPACSSLVTRFHWFNFNVVLASKQSLSGFTNDANNVCMYSM